MPAAAHRRAIRRRVRGRPCHYVTYHLSLLLAAAARRTTRHDLAEATTTLEQASGQAEAAHNGMICVPPLPQTTLVRGDPNRRYGGGPGLCAGRLRLQPVSTVALAALEPTRCAGPLSPPVRGPAQRRRRSASRSRWRRAATGPGRCSRGRAGGGR